MIGTPSCKNDARGTSLDDPKKKVTWPAVSQTCKSTSSSLMTIILSLKSTPSVWIWYHTGTNRTTRPHTDTQPSDRDQI